MAVRKVALLVEGVDRNLQQAAALPAAGNVALLVEGVDRNKKFAMSLPGRLTSPSSWRAWIEIGGHGRDL